MKEPIICPGCHQEIDPEVCHCGDIRQAPCHGEEHSFVPMGCECGRIKDHKCIYREDSTVCEICGS